MLPECRVENRPVIKLDTGEPVWQLERLNFIAESTGCPNMTAFPQQSSWLKQTSFRINTYWQLKILGITAYMIFFMMGYFWLLKHTIFPVTVIPATGLDRLISFQPWCIVPYSSLWLYISLVPWLFHSWRELAPYLSAVTVLSLIGFSIFLFWPTIIPKLNIDWAQYPAVAFLKSVDASGNACPSLHVAFAVLTGIWLHRLLKQMRTPISLRVLNICWCLLIAYSTLATKQHVALDVVSGAALGLCVTMLFLHILPSLGILRGTVESG
jgi:membrane-associated phospholipid phosphatase